MCLKMERNFLNDTIGEADKISARVEISHFRYSENGGIGSLELNSTILGRRF